MIERTSLRDASRVLREIAELDLDEPAERAAARRAGCRSCAASWTSTCWPSTRGREFVHAVLDSQSGIPDLPEPGRDFLEEARGEGAGARGGRRRRAAARAPGCLAAAAGSRASRLRADRRSSWPGTLLDPVLAEQREKLVQDYQTFRQLEVQKDDLRASHLLLFLMVTLLILLASSWVGPLPGAAGDRADPGPGRGDAADQRRRPRPPGGRGGRRRAGRAGRLLQPHDRGAGGNKELLERRTAELIKAQQLAAWNEAARRIAHEIKNPLTPIRLAAERLLRKHRQGDPGLGEAIEEGVEIIVREVVTLQGMVDEFSRYARMPRPRPGARSTCGSWSARPSTSTAT